MNGGASPSRPRWGVLSQGNYAGTDQGVDFTGAGPIPALDEGTVTDTGSVSIIEGGSYPYVVYQLQNGPHKGRYVYVMESFTPRVRPGQRLRQGDPLGVASGGVAVPGQGPPVGIEYGFNRQARGINPVATLYPNPHSPKPEGELMWTYMQQLFSGAPTDPIGPTNIKGAPAPSVNPVGGASTPAIDHGPALAAAESVAGGALVDTWSAGFGGGGILGFLGDITGIGDVVDFLKAALWLVNPMNWLRLFELFVGGILFFLSMVGLGVILAARSGVVQETAGVAQQAPGPLGAAGRAVTTASQLRSPQTRRRVAAERIPQRLAERAATQQGEREERQSQRRARLAAARSSGRRRVQAARTRENSDRFGEVPF